MILQGESWVRSINDGDDDDDYFKGKNSSTENNTGEGGSEALERRNRLARAVAVALRACSKGCCGKTAPLFLKY